MEALNIQHLSLILDQDLVLIQEDIQKHWLAEQPKERHVPTQRVILNSEVPTSSVEQDKPEEEYAVERMKMAYEGNFEKGILIIYQGKQLEELHREFLMKILGAVGCSLKDVALASAHHIKDLPSETINDLAPRKCLVFGTVNHTLMTFKPECYEIVSGETEYFFADDLEELANNVDLKRKLWKGLQALFNINK